MPCKSFLPRAYVAAAEFFFGSIWCELMSLPIIMFYDIKEVPMCLELFAYGLTGEIIATREAPPGLVGLPPDLC